MTPKIDRKVSPTAACAAAMAVSAALIATNIFFAHHDAATVIACIAGSVFYCVAYGAPSVGAQSGGSYIITGEAAAWTAGALMTVMLFATAPAAIFITGAAFLMLYLLYTGYYLNLAVRQQAHAGLAAGSILAVFLFFIAFYDSSFNHEGAVSLFAGIKARPFVRAWPAAVFSAISCGMLAFAIFARHEIRLATHGRFYCEGGGFMYARTRLLYLCAKGAASSCAVFLIGWLGGGVGLLYDRRAPYRSRVVIDIGSTIAYTQVLLLAGAVVPDTIVVSIAIIVSSARGMRRQAYHGAPVYD